MKTFLITTAVALTLAAPAAYAQISTTTNTNAGATTSVGNSPSTVRVDGNSTVRTYGDGTSSITRPANDAVDNSRLGTEINSGTTVNTNRGNVNTRINSRNVAPDLNLQNTTDQVYDGATGITNTVTGTTSGAMGSVADTIKSPLGANAAVRSNTSVGTNQ